MSLETIPFFMMDGNAKEAISYYKNILTTEVVFIQMNGDQVDHAMLKSWRKPSNDLRTHL